LEFYPQKKVNFFRTKLEKYGATLFEGIENIEKA
jgi:hypothetical protein